LSASGWCCPGLLENSLFLFLLFFFSGITGLASYAAKLLRVALRFNVTIALIRLLSLRLIRRGFRARSVNK
jgi:hypothetical protein